MDLEKLIAESREKRAGHLAKSEAILKTATDEKRQLTDDEKKAFDAELDAARAASADEARYQSLLDEKEKAAADPRAGRRSLPQPIGGREERPVIRTPNFAGKLRSFRCGTRQESVDAAYRSGQFLLATLAKGSMRDRADEWCRSNGVWSEIEERTLTTAANSLGGVLVPVQMENAIIDLREERGVARRNLKSRTMTGDTLIVPRRTSGVTAYFVLENGEITASDKGWDNVQLVARKLAAMCKYSSDISEDSIISIADDLSMEIAYAFADKEDECTFNGDGTSTYGGVVGLKNVLNAGSKYTAITGNTAFSTLDLDDFEAMVGKIPQYAVGGAKWFISRVGWANSMLRLAEAAGGNTVAQVAGGAPLQFLGFPVEIVQVMNSTTSAQTSTDGICYLANLDMAATMGTRRGVTIAVDGSRYFEYDQLAIRGTQRFDIVVHEKGTSTVAGPIVMMSTPSS